jgi:hypothetical protein
MSALAKRLHSFQAYSAVIIEPLFSLHFFDPGDGALQVGFRENGDKPGFGHVPPERFSVIHPLVGVKILDRRIEAVQEMPPSRLRGPHGQSPAEPVARGIPQWAFRIALSQVFSDQDLQIRYHQPDDAPGLQNPEALPEELPGFLKIEVFQ